MESCTELSSSKGDRKTWERERGEKNEAGLESRYEKKSNRGGQQKKRVTNKVGRGGA